ncbi:MAG: ADP-ribosylglycohydrolase family protein [Cryomorphaceae bacterium]|nr:MAG: ADP-ribosylglycohydrolase family protein [Cryomorphaceae bacterium]
MRKNLDQYIGCILGGAIGDALGAPIEFMSAEEIFARFGSRGVQQYVEHEDGRGEFTDDTQMLLFTAEGLLRAWQRSVAKGIGGAEVSITWHSYLRWLKTQGYEKPAGVQTHGFEDGWLIHRRELHQQRAPGNTCLAALRSGKMGTVKEPINNSKGCGTVMRIAPVGLVFTHDPELAFIKGMEFSAITHGHPSGYLSGGVLAMVFALMVRGDNLENAIEKCLQILPRFEGHEETKSAVLNAIEIHREFEGKDISYKEIESLGGAWVAEEALAISLLCALHYPHDFEKAVLTAVNHSGDSDSTGAITGNLVGYMVGERGIPENWIRDLMNAHIVRQIGEDLHTGVKGGTYTVDDEWWSKYPGY